MTNASAVNATLNATTQAVDIGTASALFFTTVIPELLSRMFVFFAAPFLYLDIWWLLIHLVLTFVLFEFYFERHLEEDLGWSAALANSIVMVFISMELLRAMYGHAHNPFKVLWNVLIDYWVLTPFAPQMIIVSLLLFLGAFGLATAIINYYHLLPRQVAYLISGHKTVNLLAYFLIVVVWRYTHGDPIPLDMVTVVALLLFGASMWALLLFVNAQRKRKRHRRKHRY